MLLPSFDYHAPSSLAEALKIKNQLGTSAPILAGGTDLIVNLKYRLASPAAVISLKNIKEMTGIEAKADSVVIKAGTSLAQTAEDEAVRKHFPILVKAIDSIGATGIQRFRGTIGGNLCLQPRCILYNQSLFWRTGKDKCHRTGGKDCLALENSQSCNAVCSSDTVPALVALSAQLTIAGSGGKRSIPVSEFFTAKGESPFNLMPEEIVTEIRLPIPWGPTLWSYQRLSFRSAVDFPYINAAATAIIDKGKVESFRAVLSAAGPAPIILKEAESAIKGQKPEPEMASKASEVALKAAEGAIVDNAVVSRDYRIKMAAVVVRRAVKEALGL
jgi:4-hydroxybenzoyl-CoA reductase subunit beta